MGSRAPALRWWRRGSIPLLASLLFATACWADGEGSTNPPLGLSDEGGVAARPVYTLDCVGTGVACTQSGSTGTITVSSGGGSAPDDAEYLVTEANGTLSAEVAPSAANQVPNSTSSTAGSWTATPTIQDLNLSDATPHVLWDVSSGDDYEAYVADSRWYLANFTDGTELLATDGSGGVYLPLLAGCNLDTDSTGKLTCGTDATSGNSFETINAPAGTDPVADSSTDTLNLTETSFLTLTGDSSTDTIDITQVTTDLGTDGLIAANAVALGTDTTNAYVADLTAGTYIDVSGGGAETANVTVTVDPTELLDVTFAAGANASQVWTWDLSGTDVSLTAESAQFVMGGDLIVRDASAHARIELDSATGDELEIYNDGSDGLVIANRSDKRNLVWLGDTGLQTLLLNSTVFPAGSVLFSDGTQLQSDSTKFYWDAAANKLGIGVVPDWQLHIEGTATNSAVNRLGQYINLFPTYTTSGAYFDAALFIVSETAGSANNTDAGLSTGHLGVLSDVSHQGTGTLGEMVGVGAAVGLGSVGNVTNRYGFQANNGIGSSGTYTNSYGSYVSSDRTSGGTITNDYGVYVTASGSVSTNDYAIYDAGGWSDGSLLQNGLSLGTAGVKLTDDADGALTFTSLGNGSGGLENLTLNFDDVSNTITATSSTGVTDFIFSNLDAVLGGVTDPTLEWRPSSGDAYESYVADSRWYLVNKTDGTELLSTDGAGGVYLPLLAGCNLDTDSTGKLTCGTDSSSGGNIFETIAVSGQSDVVADSTTDTLTLAAGSNITLTTNAGTDTVTIAATAGSGATDFNLPVYSAKLTGAYVVFTPPTADACTQGAQIDAGDGNWRLLFDPTTDECATWQFVMPSNYASTPLLKVTYSMVSATTAEVEFEAAIMCVTPGDSADINTASFSNVATTVDTVPGTAGYTDTVTLTLNDDSCAAGDTVFVVLSTDGNDATNDDATGDREVVAVYLDYT